MKSLTMIFLNTYWTLCPLTCHCRALTNGSRHLSGAFLHCHLLQWHTQNLPGKEAEDSRRIFYTLRCSRDIVLTVSLKIIFWPKLNSTAQQAQETLSAPKKVQPTAPAVGTSPELRTNTKNLNPKCFGRFMSHTELLQTPAWRYSQLSHTACIPEGFYSWKTT